jgi:hypothetical protein
VNLRSSAFLLPSPFGRSGGRVDDRFQELGEPSRRGALVSGELEHLRKIELRVRERQLSLSLRGGGLEIVGAIGPFNLDGAAAEKVELAIEGSESEPKALQERLAVAWLFSEERYQSVETRGSRECDVNCGTSGRVAFQR